MNTETKEISKIDNIKYLYSQLKHKGKFIEAVAPTFEITPLSLKNNWVSGFISVPTHHQDKFIELLQNAIKLQNEKQ